MTPSSPAERGWTAEPKVSVKAKRGDLMVYPHKVPLIGTRWRVGVVTRIDGSGIAVAHVSYTKTERNAARALPEHKGAESGQYIVPRAKLGVPTATAVARALAGQVYREIDDARDAIRAALQSATRSGGE